MRPSMRFVPVKSEDVQSAAMVFRVRELLIRQRTASAFAPPSKVTSVTLSKVPENRPITNALPRSKHEVGSE